MGTGMLLENVNNSNITSSKTSSKIIIWIKMSYINEF